MFSVSNCMHEEFRSCTKNHRRLGLDTSGWAVAVSHLSFVFCPWNNPLKLPSIFLFENSEVGECWWNIIPLIPGTVCSDPNPSGAGGIHDLLAPVEAGFGPRSKLSMKQDPKVVSRNLESFIFFFCKFRGVRHQNRYWIYLNIRSYKTKRDLRSCQFLLSCQLFPRVQTLMLLWVFLYVAIVLAMNTTRRLIVPVKNYIEMRHCQSHRFTACNGMLWFQMTEHWHGQWTSRVLWWIVWEQESLRLDRGPAFYCICYCSTTGYVSIVRSLVLHISWANMQIINIYIWTYLNHEQYIHIDYCIYIHWFRVHIYIFT